MNPLEKQSLCIDVQQHVLDSDDLVGFEASDVCNAIGRVSGIVLSNVGATRASCVKRSRAMLWPTVRPLVFCTSLVFGLSGGNFSL